MPIQYTKAEFDNAAAMILGAEAHNHLVAAGFNRADICREVAQVVFMGESAPSTKPGFVDVVRAVAKRLWRGEGDLGLLDDAPPESPRS